MVVALGVLLLLPDPALAQGFWRYFERLSGPPVSGPGFEFSFLCGGARQPAAPDDPVYFSLQCVQANRDAQWFNIGLQTYRLGGENDLTPDPHDRVDVIGFAPFVDLNFAFGAAIGGGVGVRRISAAAGSFTNPVGEVAVKVRPFRLLAWYRTGDARTALQAPRLRYDFFEVRGIAVFESEFEAGEFGRDARAVEGGVNLGLVLAFNFFSER
jgi:hypothetical protein